MEVLSQDDYTPETWALIDSAANRLQAAIEGLQEITGYNSGKIEAEYGKKYGSAYGQGDTGASGGYKIGSVDHLGAAVEFTNCAPTNKLTIAYATSNSDSKLSLYIDGVHNRDVSFPRTGSWGGTFSKISIDVDIPAGSTIKFQYDSAANIDYIIIPGIGIR
jgi:hypothetical protein